MHFEFPNFLGYYTAATLYVRAERVLIVTLKRVFIFFKTIEYRLDVNYIYRSCGIWLPNIELPKLF